MLISPSRRGTWGGSEHCNTANKINEHRITARKVNETPSPQHIFLVPWFESTLKIILLYLNNFPQNKHITTLFIVHMSILLTLVNLFSCSCEETFREARRWMKKKERSLERWPLPQIPLFFYFAHFSWCINPLTEALSGLKVLLSGASCVCVWYWQSFEKIEGQESPGPWSGYRLVSEWPLDEAE